MAHDPAHEAHAPVTAAPAPAASLTPLDESQRHAELDLLRGLAVLGILAMNVRSFGGPFATYMNPLLMEGWNQGASRAAYIATAIIFDTKMMSLFSMLFGAGAVVWLSKRTGAGKPAVWLWMRRMFWLLVIGCIHAYFIWEGDILVPYAMCGMLLLWWARRLPAWLLLGLGAALVCVGGVLWSGMGLAVESIPDEAAREQAIEGMRRSFEPGPASLERSIATATGPYPGQVRARAPMVWMIQTKMFVLYFIWRAGGMMLIGAGLMKLGVLTGRLSRGAYAAMAALGLIVGGAMAAVGVQQLEAANYAVPRRLVLDSWNYFGSLFMAIGYVGLAIWLHRAGVLGWLGRTVAAAGRMAFTNYLAQSLICTFIFYGHGLGLYGRLDYAEQLLVAAGIWALQLAWSPWWLARYQFGPMEWTWRSLTYWRLQPLARRGRALAAS